MDTQRKGPRVKPTYYFLCFDHEILDEHILALSCDEETWLYTIETSAFNGQFEHYLLGSPFHNQQIPTASGSVDSRTVTRRKHCSQRPSLDSVVESPLTNRSSLGLLGASQLLNDTLQVLFTPTRDKNFSRCTGSDSSDYKPIPERTVRLQSTNYGVLADNQSDSESYDIPIENCSPFHKHVMTDSLTTFLEKQEVSCCPPKAFQDATDHSSLVLPENYEANNSLYICGSSEQLTDSLVNFLVPNCKPPSGFEDSCMSSSIVDVEKSNDLPTSEMTDSVMDYLENVKSSSPAPLIESTTLSETENIPPDSCDNQGLVNSTYSDCTGRLKASGDGRNTEFAHFNSNFVSEKNEDGFLDEREKITFTNNSNILREKKGSGDIEDDLNIRKHFKTNFEFEFLNAKENNEKSPKGRALNNRDLNVTQELNSAEVNDFNLSKTLANEIIPNKFNAAVSINHTKRNRTFTKSEIDEALNLYKQIPSRNSTFSTTFTKMNNSESNKTNLNSTFVKPQDVSNSSMGVEDKKNSTFTIKQLNSTYDKSREMSNGAVEDDKNSTTSESSSCSTKPTSLDELRTIAQRQESNLARITSTPESSMRSSNVEATLNLEISPIRIPSAGAGRTNSESRSANCSPVRSQSSQIQPRCMHPSTKPHQQEMELRRQTLQASSLSNIARPMMSGMRVPQPVSRLSALQRPVGRPSTAPAPAPTTTTIPQVSGMRMPQPVSRLTAPQNRPVGRPSTAPAPAPAPAPTTAIPRSRASRLPMPRLRGSGIPGYKRGAQ